MIVDPLSPAITDRHWILLTLVTGLVTIGLQVPQDLYLGIGLPDHVQQILSFAIGPLALVTLVGFLGGTWRDAIRIPYMIAGLFLLIALTLGAVRNVWGDMYYAVLLTQTPLADFPDLEVLRVIHQSAGVATRSLDSSQRLFLDLGMILLSVALVRHPRFGRVWSAVGVVLHSVLLVDLFATFPGRPLEDGYSDFDLLRGGWLVVTLLLLARGLSRRPPAPIPEAPETVIA